MKVTLLYSTPIDVLALATSKPYGSKPTKGLVQRVFDLGHRSVVRHGMAAFSIENVSQSLLRQISRHPHINLTVKSSRYCDMSDSGFYVPKENIEALNVDGGNSEIIEEYKNDMEIMMEMYEKWKEIEKNGKGKDISKLFLPLASRTDLVLSGNYQALYEMLDLRSSKRAETEIRNLAIEMINILSDEIPEIFMGLKEGIATNNK